jgi:hypothetical protein
LLDNARGARQSIEAGRKPRDTRAAHLFLLYESAPLLSLCFPFFFSLLSLAQVPATLDDVTQCRDTFDSDMYIEMPRKFRDEDEEAITVRAFRFFGFAQTASIDKNIISCAWKDTGPTLIITADLVNPSL